MRGPGGSWEALWSALGKVRVPVSVALLVPMLVEEKVAFAKDALGGSADSGAAVLAPSVAVLEGLAMAAAIFMRLALS